MTASYAAAPRRCGPVPRRGWPAAAGAQGWISPVVLRGGRVPGASSSKARGKPATPDVDLFDRGTPRFRKAVEREAAALAGFLEAGCEVRVGTI